MRTTTTLTFLLASLALAACGDNLEGIADDGGDDDAPAPLGRTLTGDHVVTYRGLDATVFGEEAVDLWDTLIEAHVPTADGWRIVPGIGHRDGSFEVPDLPDGPLWLRIAVRPAGEAYYWTGADHIDLAESVLGPEDPPRADEGDQLVLAVDGLAPWRATDALAWFVPDDVVYDQNLISIDPPAVGTTDLAGAAVDWSGRVLANVDAGDPAYVVQYRTQRLAPGVDVIAPLRAAQPVLHQTAGTDGTLTATLAPAPPLTYHLSWARDAFEAERTAIHPTRAGASYYHDFAMTALPGLVDGEVWVGVEYPFVFLADPSIVQGTTPLDLGELAIPNPYPREWITDSFVVAFPVDLPLPDGTPYSLEAAIGTRRMTFSDGPAMPAITPIRAPTIAGHDGFADNTGVGVMPELAWQAPATGTATAYQIRIIEAVEQPPAPFRPGWYLTTELWVPGDVTTARIPVDVLVPGTTYAVIIRAFAQPGQDIARPYRTGGEAAFADAFFGRFTP